MPSVHNLLTALSKRLKSGPLYLSRDYLCRAQVEDAELNIEWLDGGGSVFVYIPVGSLSANEDNELLQELMDSNLFYQGTTQSALFGFDKELDEVFLFQNFQMEQVHEAHFVSSCVSMLDMAKEWQGKLMSKITPPSYVGSIARLSKS